jgi:hypothetical protein
MCFMCCRRVGDPHPVQRQGQERSHQARDHRRYVLLSFNTNILCDIPLSIVYPYLSLNANLLYLYLYYYVIVFLCIYGHHSA